MSAKISLGHWRQVCEGIAGDSTQQKINIREVWQRKFDFTSDSIIKYQVWLSDTKSEFNINSEKYKDKFEVVKPYWTEKIQYYKLEVISEHQKQIMSGIPVPTVRLSCYEGSTRFAVWSSTPSVSIISLAVLIYILHILNIMLRNMQIFNRFFFNIQ